MIETSRRREEMTLMNANLSGLGKPGPTRKTLWPGLSMLGGVGDGPFNLNRWFLVLSFVTIVLTSGASAWLLTEFVKANWLRHDGDVTMAFVTSIVRAEQATEYFATGDPSQDDQDIERLFAHISGIPDVIRTTLYGNNHTILWSSDKEFIGSEFPANRELDRAFNGELVIEQGIAGQSTKAEHAFLGNDGLIFIENYIPIFDPVDNTIVGVAEVYRIPRELLDSISRSKYLIWTSALGGALILYIALGWIVRRADVLLRLHQAEISETRALAAVGEMASAVAHGLRNPLSSIRTSAELALEDNPPAQSREAFGDIVAQADRLEVWIRELLTSSHPDRFEFELCDLNNLILANTELYKDQATRQQISLSLDLDRSMPLVMVNQIAFSQVVSSLIANSIEAMADGGTLKITYAKSENGEKAVITITDSGGGVAPGNEEELFRPFVTTKGKGLGVGLSLARRIAERHGGTLMLRNAPSRGTCATIELPIKR